LCFLSRILAGWPARAADAPETVDSTFLICAFEFELEDYFHSIFMRVLACFFTFDIFFSFYNE